MIRFGVFEYIRNKWFNICILLLLMVMMVTSTILISNVENQTRIYRFASKYIDDDSVVIGMIGGEFYRELDKYGDIHGVQSFFSEVGKGNNEKEYIRTTVYTDEVMKYMPPRLDEGEYPKESGSNDVVSALVSHNNLGYEVGDIIECKAFSITTEKTENIKVHITGILSDNQRLNINASERWIDMIYEDFFPVYSFEQENDVRFIIPEGEMNKIPAVSEMAWYDTVMINFNDNLSTEEIEDIKEKIATYEEEFMLVNFASVYNQPKKLAEHSEVAYYSNLMKYIPLFIIVVILFTICIMAMVMIKSMKSTRYFGIMYAYGMKHNTAQLMTGIEMGFNCGVALLLTVIVLKLQETFDIIGEINCEISNIAYMVMFVVDIIIVLAAVLTTRSIQKENTSVEILKELD